MPIRRAIGAATFAVLAALVTVFGSAGALSALAAGPPALVQSAVLNVSGTSAAVAYTNPVSQGNLLVAAVRLGSSSAAAAVSDNNGNAWQRIDRRSDTGGGSGDDLELWYAPNASITPNARPTLTITSTVSATLRAVVAEYSGVSSATPLDQHATNIGSSTSPAVVSGAAAQANELVLGYAEVENTSTFTPRAGYVVDAVVPTSPGTKLALEHTVSTASGAQTASFTVSNQAWAIGVATFRPASTDTTPPTVVSVTPASGATGVALASLVGGNFSEALDPTTVTSSTLTLVKQGTTTLIPGTVAYLASSFEPFFTPTGGLLANTCYTATLKGGSGGIKDVAGNALAADFVWSFCTIDTLPPTVTSVTPASGATGVALASLVGGNFSEALDPTTVTSSTLTLVKQGTTTLIPGTVAYLASSFEPFFTPTGGLLANTCYTATLKGGSGGIKDVAGNALAADFVWSFCTIDTLPPTVTSVTPASGATGVALASLVGGNFSEALDPTTVTSSTLTLVKQGTTTLIPGTVAYLASSFEPFFTPTGGLLANTCYTATLKGGSGGIKDVAGNALAADFVWSFCTIDTLPPTVTSVTPANGTVAAVDVQVCGNFSETVNPGTFTSTTFFVIKQGTTTPIPATIAPSLFSACLTPTGGLQANSAYTATFKGGTGGIQDYPAGNPMAADFTWSFSTAAAAGTVTNGGFENGVYNSLGSPPGWAPDAFQLSSAAFAWDNTEAHSGTKSVAINLLSANDARWIQDVPVQPNTLYVLSGWIKTFNVAHTAESVDAGANLSILGGFTRSGPVFGTSDWTPVSVTFNSGTATVVTIAARLGMYSGTTTGSAWFDDIQLAPAPQQLVNPGVELGTGVPTGWSSVPRQGSPTFVWDSAIAHTGTRSLQVAATAQADGLWTQTVPVNTDSEYQLSAWIRTSSATSAGGRLLVNDASGGSFLTAGSPPIGGTQDWQLQSVTFVTGGSSAISVGCNLVGSGTVWCDDFTLTKLRTLPRRQVAGNHVVVDIYPDYWGTTDVPTYVALLDQVYAAHEALVGAHPYGGNKIVVKQDATVDGIFGLSGQPIHIVPSTGWAQAVDSFHLDFGVTHELGHDFDDFPPGVVGSPARSGYIGNLTFDNGEHWANLKVLHAFAVMASANPTITVDLPGVCTNVPHIVPISQFDQAFTNCEAQPWISSGRTDYQNMGNDTYTGLQYMLATQVGWGTFTCAFQAYDHLQAPATDLDKVALWAVTQGRCAGVDLTPQYRSWGFPIPSPPDIALSMTGPSQVTPGNNIPYALVVTNNGVTAAAGVGLTDTLPAGSTLVSATSPQGTCTQAQSTVTCALGVLERGASANVSIVVLPGGAGTVTNSATLTATATDPVSSNNTASVQTTVSQVTPALVQSAVLNVSGTSAAVAYTNPVSQGNLLVAAIRLGSSSAAAAVSDNNGNAWQRIDRRSDTGGGSGDDLELWYAPNASITPNARPTLTITSTVSATLRAVVAEYTGVSSATPLDQHATNIGSSTSPAVVSGAAAQANELVLGYAEVENTSTFTPRAGYVVDAVVPTSPGTKLALEHTVSTASDAQTASFTVSNQAWAIGVATFRSGP